MKFYVKHTVLAFCLTIISIRGLRKDYNILWKLNPIFQSRVNNSNNKKLDAKAMLDLKYKHRNASFGTSSNSRKHNYNKFSEVLPELMRTRRVHKDIWLKIRQQKYRVRLRDGHPIPVHDSRSHSFQDVSTDNLKSEIRRKLRIDRKMQRFRHKIRWGNYVLQNQYILSSYRKIPKVLKLVDDIRNGTEQQSFLKTEEIASSEFDPHLSPYSIKRHMDSLQTHFPTANITVEVVAKTISFNDIVLLKITRSRHDVAKFYRIDETDEKYSDESHDKKIILIVHGLNVMGFDLLECMSIERNFVKLLRYYTAHLDKFDIFIMPMANPDGVEMHARVWNKNAAPQKSCSGVAVDRNFDVAWDDKRNISSCSQQYPGPYPFSEIESKAVKHVLHSNSNRLQAYINVHAGTYSPDVFKGDAVLYPKGYTEVTSQDDRYVDLKGEINEAMKLADFKVLTVTVDTLYNWYGLITGSSVDYASKTYDIPFCLEFVMQLYDNDMAAELSHEMETNAALDEVWGRVINVTFTNIYNYMIAAELNNQNVI